MAIKKQVIEDKSIKTRGNNSREIGFNYPGKVTIKANSKEDADEKFKKLNKK